MAGIAQRKVLAATARTDRHHEAIGVHAAAIGHLDADRALSAARKWLGEESPAYPHFALAFVDGEVSGLASVAIAHPGIDLERLLFLKDLFVCEKVRNAGVGRALIGFLADHCLREGIGRIDLTTEDWNEGALRFYGRLGAERHGQKVFLRLSGEALKSG